MVPVLAVGFADLQKRIQIQDQQYQIHQEKLKEISQQIDTLSKAHHGITLIKLNEYKRKQRQIVHRVLQLMKSVQLLRNRGYSLHADEESLVARLKSMQRDLEKPAIFRGRLNEIWASVMQLGESKSHELGIADTEALEPILQALDGMQTGLGHLTDVLRQDQDTVQIIARGYQEIA